jgi:ADP-ribose pyrophosphatase YjhB (NUDIX family)
MIDDTWYARPEGVRDRTSAGGVVCRASDGRVLVALTTEPGMGAYILPKGGVKRGESLQDAAVREINEEAGFTDLRMLTLIGVRERLNFTRTRWITTHYFLYVTAQVHGAPTDPFHRYVAAWFGIDTLPPMFWPDQRELIESQRVQIEERVRAASAHDAR